MRITEIRDVDVPLDAVMSNAVVDFSGHAVSLVAVVSDEIRDGRPLSGVAFNSIGRHAQSGILGDRMIPRVLSANPDDLLDDRGVIDPTAVLGCMMKGEKPGGHGDRASAAAAVELACWDLLAKSRDEPAWRTIARAHGNPEICGGVPVYAAGGYYHEDDDLGRLRDEVAAYLAEGYPAVKIKIGGLSLHDDIARVAAAVETAGGGQHVAVDANGAFDRDRALAYAEALAPYDLRWYEEPVDPLDFAGLADLTAVYDGPVATGENLFSVRDVENLLRFGGLRPDRDLLQMDAGLSYGLSEYARMVDVMERHGFDRGSAVPHGGHLLNLHIVTGLGLGGCEAYPGVFQPVGGYSDDCVIEGGRITPGAAPGFGLEAKEQLGPIIEELVP